MATHITSRAGSRTLKVRGFYTSFSPRTTYGTPNLLLFNEHSQPLLYLPGSGYRYILTPLPPHHQLDHSKLGHSASGRLVPKGPLPGSATPDNVQERSISSMIIVVTSLSIATMEAVEIIDSVTVKVSSSSTEKLS